MAGQSALRPAFGPAGVGDLARRLVAAALALALLAAILSAVGVPDRASTRAPAAPRTLLEGDSLHAAVVGVLAAEGAPPNEAAPGAAPEDEWATLAEVLGRWEAQQSVADGTRPPLMNAPPPAPASRTRDRALARSAAVYVRTALETHDVRALQRARDLLEMRSR